MPLIVIKVSLVYLSWFIIALVVVVHEEKPPNNNCRFVFRFPRTERNVNLVFSSSSPLMYFLNVDSFNVNSECLVLPVDWLSSLYQSAQSAGSLSVTRVERCTAECFPLVDVFGEQMGTTILSQRISPSNISSYVI